MPVAPAVRAGTVASADSVALAAMAVPEHREGLAVPVAPAVPCGQPNNGMPGGSAGPGGGRRNGRGRRCLYQWRHPSRPTV